MCPHTPRCPDPGEPDREAARTVVSHPEQGWSLLCNGIVVFEDTGELLPGGSSRRSAPANRHRDDPAVPGEVPGRAGPYHLGLTGRLTRPAATGRLSSSNPGLAGPDLAGPDLAGPDLAVRARPGASAG